jgi:transcriptional regulator with XRE-family HTH domain
MSQRELAERVGRKETYISMILLGQRKPAKRDIQRWASALGLNDVERAEFMELGGLIHCPEWIAREYLRMKTELAKRPSEA